MKTSGCWPGREQKRPGMPINFVLAHSWLQNKNGKVLGIAARTLRFPLFPNKRPSYRVGVRFICTRCLTGLVRVMWHAAPFCLRGGELGRKHGLTLGPGAAFWGMADTHPPLWGNAPVSGMEGFPILAKCSNPWGQYWKCSITLFSSFNGSLQKRLRRLDQQFPVHPVSFWWKTGSWCKCPRFL